MAEAIVSRVARLLDDFAKDGKLRVFGGEFDKLEKTVSFLQNIVHDAEGRSLRCRSFEYCEIKEWLDLENAF
ncbi:hypothetical protein NL676_008234 [Syzygium grande]|nr:hypothetical protein NL676_008234 [Syzygium grande]